MRVKEAFLPDGTEPRLQIGLRYTAHGSDLRNDMFLLPTAFATEEGYLVESDSVPLGFHVAACIYLPSVRAKSDSLLPIRINNLSWIITT